jgi:hypothetical protein
LLGLTVISLGHQPSGHHRSRCPTALTPAHLDPFVPNVARLEPGGICLSHRFFPATVMAGRVYLDDRDGLAYCDEAVVDMLVERVVHRKARTEAELLAVVRESERGLPAIRVWVHEGLEGVVTAK